jgi:hypothetical protein
VLYGVWVANVVAFNVDAMHELAAHFSALAEKQTATGPVMIGHRLMATTLALTGDIADGKEHYDQALATYDPAEHIPLATRFGQDIGVVILSFRSVALWLLGYPEASRNDAEHALKNAREIGQAATLMYALSVTAPSHFFCGNFAAANSQADELVALAEEKSALYWKAQGTIQQGSVFALTGKASNAVQMITSGMTALAVNGSNLVHTVVLIVFVEGLCGPRPIR